MNINGKTIDESKFNADQMEQILLGLEKRVDASIYADPKFSDRQMNQIRLGLKKGINVDIYARSDYNHLQMHEIRVGLEGGLDVSIYADSKFSSAQMRRGKFDMVSKMPWMYLSTQIRSLMRIRCMKFASVLRED